MPSSESCRLRIEKLCDLQHTKTYQKLHLCIHLCIHTKAYVLLSY